MKAAILLSILSSSLTWGFVPSSGAQVGNLIVNGSFESLSSPATDWFLELPAGSEILTGWDIYEGGAYLYSAHNPFPSLRPFDGEYFVALGSGILQTFPAIRGRTYKLTFRMAGEPFYHPAPVSLAAVTADNANRLFTMPTTPAVTWVEQSVTFVADSSPMSIEFYDATPGPNAGSRVLLDAVTVLAGPVPSLTVIDDLRRCAIYYYCDGHGNDDFVDPNDHFVIAPNGTNATVILDASASYDPNGAPLQFTWERLGEGQGLFASGVRATNDLNGDTRVRLHVGNGTTEALLEFTVYLETPADAISKLKTALLEFDDRYGIPRGVVRALHAPLVTAAHRFQMGDMPGTVKSLELFQKRITARSSLLGDATTANFVHIAQQIIDALNARK